ncbi:hypothetical protein H310_13250, partial [Aphanomyces invadans]
LGDGWRYNVDGEVSRGTLQGTSAVCGQRVVARVQHCRVFGLVTRADGATQKPRIARASVAVKEVHASMVVCSAVGLGARSPACIGVRNGWAGIHWIHSRLGRCRAST